MVAGLGGDKRGLSMYLVTPPPSWARHLHRLDVLHPLAVAHTTLFTINSYKPSGHHQVDDLEGQNVKALGGIIAQVKLLKDVSVFHCVACLPPCLHL